MLKILTELINLDHNLENLKLPLNPSWVTTVSNVKMDSISHRFILCVVILSMKTVWEDKGNAVDVDFKWGTLLKENKDIKKVPMTRPNFSKLYMKENRADFK